MDDTEAEEALARIRAVLATSQASQQQSLDTGQCLEGRTDTFPSAPWCRSPMTSQDAVGHCH